ncbi:hypothetical protein IVB41_21910 [Bradyrhizobium sp. 44]|uniref:hypothetical protein n=1 Tax=Bradyrhizobium sp. 44 TaxID=2782675 RepID=UPI001FF8371C|nr:hypothetical protein [Bradyrhizobium sp. 44]MCK1286580.1 hypothetical protein [Bradyrhizobium sp. 44]
MPMHASYTANSTENLATITDSAGASAIAVMPNGIMPGTAVGRAMADLSAATESFIGVVQRNAAQLLPAVLTAAIRTSAASTLGKPFRSLTVAGQNETQAQSAALVRATAVDPATPANAALRQRALDLYSRAQSAAERMSLINNFSYEQLAGLIAAGIQNELPDDRKEMLLHRYQVLRFVETAGIQSDYSLKPTVENPTATGPDVDAAIRAAETATDKFETRKDDLAAIDTALQSTARLVALACKMSIADAYNMLSGQQQ